MRIVTFLCVLIAGAPLVRGENASRLVPAKTYALIVGVLDWEQKTLATYPKENRQDVALHKQLLAFGVPDANMMLLLCLLYTSPSPRD